MIDRVSPRISTPLNELLKDYLKIKKPHHLSMSAVFTFSDN